MRKLASKTNTLHRNRHKDYPPTRLSVYEGGSWKFAQLLTPTKQTESQEFFYIPYRYGVVNADKTEPSQTAVRGEPGGYVARSTQRTLTVVSEESFLRIFPPKLLNRPAPPTTSDALTNPNYVTNVVRKERSLDSNTIQVGNNSFRVTTPGRTVVTQSSGEQTSPAPSPSYTF